jgi:chorismate mutase/prephenate dehydratase
MTDPTPRDLSAIRQELDNVDRSLVELLARRFALVEAVGEAKGTTDTPIRDLDRERTVLGKVSALAVDQGVSPDLVRRVFREIIGHAVDRQVAELTRTSTAPLTVAFQGVPLAYSHLAAQKYLAASGREARYAGQVTFADVVTAVESGQADLAVLPIENTTAGSINQVYDLLQRSRVHVVGEETWRVDHCLAALEEVPIASLTRVLSHPQGLEQCSNFLRENADVRAVTVFDTAEAMRVVAQSGEPSWAAIGSQEAADAHGLTVLRRGLADQEENFTRFLVLAREPIVVPSRVPAKTSVVLVTRHEEGALVQCLDALARTGHSMTKLESRPRPGSPFEYLFFLDFEGNTAEPRTQAVLEEIGRSAKELKVLGSYPAKVVRGDALSGDDALEAVLPRS